MITGFFIKLVSYLLTFLVDKLPTSDGFPEDMIAGFEYLSSFGSLLNTLLPVTTLSIALAILILVDNSTLAFKTFKWVISHLPFIGGRG